MASSLKRWHGAPAFPDALQALACMMVIWCLAWPGSWRSTPGSTHEARLYALTDAPHIPVARDIFTRWSGEPVVRYCHVLASGVWSLLAVLQLRPHSASHHPALHRAAGYAFLAMGATVVVGYVGIAATGLVHYGIVLHLLAAWFVATAVVAVRRARAGDYAGHRRWILRHLSSGLWVAAQRLLILTVLPLLGRVGLLQFSTVAQKRAGFEFAEQVAVAWALCACELHVRSGSPGGGWWGGAGGAAAKTA